MLLLSVVAAARTVSPRLPSLLEAKATIAGEDRRPRPRPLRSFVVRVFAGSLTEEEEVDAPRICLVEAEGEQEQQRAAMDEDMIDKYVSLYICVHTLTHTRAQ